MATIMGHHKPQGPVMGISKQSGNTHGATHGWEQQSNKTRTGAP